MPRTTNESMERRLAMGVRVSDKYLTTQMVADEYFAVTRPRVSQMLNTLPSLRERFMLVSGTLLLTTRAAMEEWSLLPKEEKERDKGTPGHVLPSEDLCTTAFAATVLKQTRGGISALILSDREFASLWFYVGTHLVADKESVIDYAKTRVPRGMIEKNAELDRLRTQSKLNKEERKASRSAAAHKAWESRKRNEKEAENDPMYGVEGID